MFNYLPFVSVVGGHFNYYYFLLFDCTLNAKQISTIKTNKTQMSNGYYTNDNDVYGYGKDNKNDKNDGDGDDDEAAKKDEIGDESVEQNCKDVIDNNNYKTLDKIYYYINTREV